MFSSPHGDKLQAKLSEKEEHSGDFSGGFCRFMMNITH